MNLIGKILAVLLILAIVFFGGRWVVNQLENASNPAAVEEPAEPVAVDMPGVPAVEEPDLEPVPVPGSESANEAPDNGTGSNLQPGNPDQVHLLSRKGWGDVSFRFEVQSGETASGALMATTNGTIKRLAVVCDDVCTGIFLIRGDAVTDLTDLFTIYVPEEATLVDRYGDDWVRLESVTDFSIDKMVGARQDDILTFWVASDAELEFQTGDQLFVEAFDNQKVQVGITAFWLWE